MKKSIISKKPIVKHELFNIGDVGYFGNDYCHVALTKAFFDQEGSESELTQEIIKVLRGNPKNFKEIILDFIHASEGNFILQSFIELRKLFAEYKNDWSKRIVLYNLSCELIAHVENSYWASNFACYKNFDDFLWIEDLERTIEY